MISVESAKQSLLSNSIQLGSETLPLAEAAGRTLAADIVSPVDHPAFDQTAVDGYAFRHQDFASGIHEFKLVGEVPAGAEFTSEVEKGGCIRIFTGAAMPSQVDTVIMQELIEEVDGVVKIQDPKVKPGKNVRKQAEQIATGQTALISGTILTPTSIGFLASLGIAEVEVAKIPRIGITVTGNEFAATKDELKHGKIFESNGGMLKAAFEKIGLTSAVQFGPDDPALLKEKIGAQLESSDILVVTGGVSVGKYDFTRPVLEELGFEVVFHKIAQKPGKPMLFARKGDKFAFGMPGNPRAVMVGFFEYILPFVRAMTGCPAPFLPAARLPLKNDWKGAGGRAQFLSAGVDAGGVEILDGQGSHMLQSMSLADAIAYIPADSEDLSAGSLVEVHFPVL